MHIRKKLFIRHISYIRYTKLCCYLLGKFLYLFLALIHLLGCDVSTKFIAGKYIYIRILKLFFSYVAFFSHVHKRFNKCMLVTDGSGYGMYRCLIIWSNDTYHLNLNTFVNLILHIIIVIAHIYITALILIIRIIIRCRNNLICKA